MLRVQEDTSWPKATQLILFFCISGTIHVCSELLKDFKEILQLAKSTAMHKLGRVGTQGVIMLEIVYFFRLILQERSSWPRKDGICGWCRKGGQHRDICGYSPALFLKPYNSVLHYMTQASSAGAQDECCETLCVVPLRTYLCFQQPSVSPGWVESPLIFTTICYVVSYFQHQCSQLRSLALG